MFESRFWKNKKRCRSGDVFDWTLIPFLVSVIKISRKIVVVMMNEGLAQRMPSFEKSDLFINVSMEIDRRMTTHAIFRKIKFIDKCFYRN